MLTAILLALFIICVAASWFQGTWGNIITILNMSFAAMIGFNYFEPLANQLDKATKKPELSEFICLWGLFLVTFLLLRLFTDFLSRKRVKFEFWTETVARSITAIWIGWIFVGIVCASLHVAPLGPSPMGFQPSPTSGNFLGFSPGKQWLAFMHTRSQGALSKSQPNTFDPDGTFIIRHHQRRSQ